MRSEARSHGHFEWSPRDEPERGAAVCSKCDNFVSRSALVCPACGRLFPGHRFLKLLLVIAAIGLYCLLMYEMLFRRLFRP